MTDSIKVGPRHLDRQAVVYVRQSTASQVRITVNSPPASTPSRNARITSAGPRARLVIDEDLGLSGANASNRNGFARLTAEVALGHVGIVLGLEVSRLARNNG